MKINPELEQYLAEIKIPIRLSCLDESGWPVVLSLWYLFDGGVIYCATAEKSRVASYLIREPRCAYEIAADQPPYCGVRGRALATIDPDRGIEILERLLYRYLGGIDNPLAKKLLGRNEPEIAICLKPQTAYTWNFDRRMKDSLSHAEPKPCPD